MVVQCDTTFQVGFKKDLSENLVMMRVQNRLFHQRIILRGVKWLGKHYYLSTDDASTYKPYTQLVSMANEVVDYRNNLLKLVQIRGNSLGDSEIEQSQFNLESFSNELSFAIKPYRLRSGALSQKITNLTEGADI
jgi:hypothetical protein